MWMINQILPAAVPISDVLFFISSFQFLSKCVQIALFANCVSVLLRIREIRVAVLPNLVCDDHLLAGLLHQQMIKCILRLWKKSRHMHHGGNDLSIILCSYHNVQTLLIEGNAELSVFLLAFKKIVFIDMVYEIGSKILKHSPNAQCCFTYFYQIWNCVFLGIQLLSCLSLLSCD